MRIIAGKQVCVKIILIGNDVIIPDQIAVGVHVNNLQIGIVDFPIAVIEDFRNDVPIQPPHPGFVAVRCHERVVDRSDVVAESEAD